MWLVFEKFLKISLLFDVSALGRGSTDQLRVHRAGLENVLRACDQIFYKFRRNSFAYP